MISLRFEKCENFMFASETGTGCIAKSRCARLPFVSISNVGGGSGATGPCTGPLGDWAMASVKPADKMAATRILFRMVLHVSFKVTNENPRPQSDRASGTGENLKIVGVPARIVY